MTLIESLKQRRKEQLEREKSQAKENLPLQIQNAPIISEGDIEIKLQRTHYKEAEETAKDNEPEILQQF